MASWKDTQKIFETETGQALSLFLKQCVCDTGVADLEMGEIRIEKKFSHRPAQKEIQFTYPCYILFPKRKENRNSQCHRKKRFPSLFDKGPVEVVIGEKYDIFRRVYPKETHPTIERLITDKKTIIAMQPDVSNLYTELIAAFGENGSVIEFMKRRPDVTREYGIRGKENIATMQYSSQRIPEQIER
ncbi:MAG: hypothetical protein QXP27_01490 [Candidatus Methanomethyliaceae archaeon]